MASRVKEVGRNATNSNASSRTISVAAGGVPIGDHVVVWVVHRATAAGVTCTVTDARGNTYQQDTQLDHTGGDLYGYLHSAKVTTALLAGDLITCTFSATVSGFAIVAHQWNGLASTSWLDQVAIAQGSGLSPNSGNITTLNANDILIGAFADRGVPTFTPGAGWSAADNDFADAGNQLKNVTVEQLVSSTGTYAASGTLSGSQLWLSAIAAYKTSAIAASNVAPIAGGGDLTSQGLKGITADPITSSDGGDLTSSGSKSVASPNSLPGGGSLTAVIAKGAKAPSVMTGGGDPVASYSRGAVYNLSGSGVLELCGEAVMTYTVGLLRYGSSAITGGGDFATFGTKTARVPAPIAGGGNLTPGPSLRTSVGFTSMTGGGDLNLVSRKEIASPANITGGGDLLVSTSVPAILALLYTIDTQIGKSLAQNYIVTNISGRSLETAFVVKSPAGKSLSQLYVVIAQAGASLGIPYNIVQNNIAGSSLIQPYLIRISTGRSNAQPYTVKSIIGNSNAQPFVINQLTGTSLETPFGVIETVGDSLTQLWEINNIIGDSLEQPFVVLQSAGAGRTVTLPYTINKELAKSVALPYRVSLFTLPEDAIIVYRDRDVIVVYR